MTPMLPLQGLPADARVVLTAARCAVGSVAPAAVREESRAVDDWPEALATARLQGLTGTLCRVVLTHAADELPPEVVEEMRELRRGLGRRALDMSRRLLGVLTLLQKADVRALAYKGPALSEGVYADVAARSWCDLDLIVAAQDVDAARAALEEAGFVPHAGGARLGAAMTAAEQELSFHHATNGLAVDLHWRVGLRFAGASLDGADLLGRAVVGEVLERPVLVPSPADVALLCSLHGASHNWPQLDLVLSGALALQALGEQDAAVLEDVARRGGCARRAHIGTLLARSLLGAVVPRPALLPAVKDRRAGRLAADVGATLLWRRQLDLERPRRRRRQREHAGEVLWQLAALDSRRAAAAHAWERLFRPGALDTGGPPDSGAPVRAMLRRQARIWR